MKRLLNRLRCILSRRAGVPAGLSLRRRARWAARRWLRNSGWTGVLAIGILAISPAFYFSAIRPVQERLDSARHSVVSLHERLASSGKSGAPGLEAQLAEFYGKFPKETCSPQWLEKLVALAEKRGLTLNDGEYKATRDKTGKLLRYQMTLPVKGEYPQIRKFLSDLPGALPAVALENVQFERPKVADPKVEAKIKLALYLEQSS